jgi:hypothetical protein
MVVDMPECPRSSFITGIGVPAIVKWEAKVCLDRAADLSNLSA